MKLRGKGPMRLSGSSIQEFVEDVPCDLCGHRNEEHLFDKQGTLTGYVFRVVVCRDCCLMYLNPRLNDTGLSLLYDGQYYRGGGFDPHVNYLSDVDDNQQRASWLEAHEHIACLNEICPPPARMLDLGCGIGSLLRLARNVGYDADGFEISQFASDYVEGIGFRVFRNTKELPSGHYDVVTAVEVLEHCSSATQLLKAVYDCLKPGGIFYYTTTNFDGYVEKLKRGIDTPNLNGYILPEGHVCFFSTATMRRYLEKSGFSRTVPYYARRYEKGSRVYKMLRRLHLASEAAESPQTAIQKAAYFIAQRGAGLFGLRRRFPLAIK